MRALLVTTGSRGDVQPFIALARGLEQAGHEALLAAPRRFAALADPYRIAFVGLDDSMLDLQDELAGKGTRAAFTAARAVRPLMRRWLAGLADELAAEPTDVVVYAPKALGAPDIADRIGARSVLASTIPLFQPTRFFPVPIVSAAIPRPLHRASWRLASAVEAPWRGLVRHWRNERLGLPGPGTGLARRVARSGALNAWSRHLLPAPPDWPDDAAPLGFWPLPADPDWRPPKALTRFLDQGTPPVYVGFGSAIGGDPEETTRAVIEALRMTGRRGVVATGWGALRSVSSNEDVCFVDAVPHDWLLPRTALAVHHGGVGTVAAAMRAGVPQVIKPFVGDQSFWARRVHSLGIAPPSLHDLTAEHLASAIEHAARLADQAQAVGSLLHAEDGITSAVEALER